MVSNGVSSNAATYIRTYVHLGKKRNRIKAKCSSLLDKVKLHASCVYFDIFFPVCVGETYWRCREGEEEAGGRALHTPTTPPQEP